MKFFKLRQRDSSAALACSTAALCALLLTAPLAGQDARQEEAEDYFEKWLKEDVAYIISEQEKDVFLKLSTTEEKEQFIEQFWYRRDPDFLTEANEFKEEHYRRIAYANEHFASGLPGWRTDRGRVYIIHGPPAEIRKFPNGGSYQRPRHEGGGITQVYPFEIWRYRHVEGMGSDIILEFVDPTGSGEYRLALRREEKDAFLTQRGSGLTTAEELGLAQRKDRPAFSPGNRETYPLAPQRVRDNPFLRYERYAQIMAPEPLQYKDLQQLVNVKVGFDNMPFQARTDYFRLNENSMLAPVSLELKNRELTFQDNGDSLESRVAVYGIVTSIRNRIVKEFDDELALTLPDSPQGQALRSQGRSVYQKMLQLEPGLRYKIDLVVKDLHSGRVGTVQKSIIPPKYDLDEQLAVSSLMLSDSIAALEEVPDDLSEMFVIGDIKVRPSISQVFRRDQDFGAYLHVYGAELDQSTLQPSLKVRYEVIQDGKTLLAAEDFQGESTQYFSSQRVVLVKGIPLDPLPAGDYLLRVQIEDQISGKKTTAQQSFTVEAPASQAGTR